MSLTTGSSTAVEVSGNALYIIGGQGSLSFYGPAESSLGVSGNWNSYSATVTGSIALTLTTAGLSLNGQALPAGTYTVTTSSATLIGSGPSTSPNFTGSASISATGERRESRAGDRNSHDRRLAARLRPGRRDVGLHGYRRGLSERRWHRLGRAQWHHRLGALCLRKPGGCDDRPEYTRGLRREG